MQKAITTFTIGALVSFETTALGLEAEAEVGGPLQDLKKAWRAYWQDQQLEYTFGTGPGEYNKRCTKKAEYEWFFSREFSCPSIPTEKKQKKCLKKNKKKFNKRMKKCVNNDTTPLDTGVDLPESCRAIGITSKFDRAYTDLVAYN